MRLENNTTMIACGKRDVRLYLNGFKHVFFRSLLCFRIEKQPRQFGTTIGKGSCNFHPCKNM